MNNDRLKTLKANELGRLLIKLGKTKVYLSSDSEGNSYSTIDAKWSLQYDALDDVLCLMPFEEGLDSADICPKEHEQITKELEQEHPEMFNKHQAKISGHIEIGDKHEQKTTE